jgi:hypothetical protein
MQWSPLNDVSFHRYYQASELDYALRRLYVSSTCASNHIARENRHSHSRKPYEMTILTQFMRNSDAMPREQQKFYPGIYCRNFKTTYTNYINPTEITKVVNRNTMWCFGHQRIAGANRLW